MRVIAGRPQIPVATALHQLRLIPPAQHVPEKLVPVIEPYGAGALQPNVPSYGLTPLRKAEDGAITGCWNRLQPGLGEVVDMPHGSGASFD